MKKLAALFSHVSMGAMAAGVAGVMGSHDAPPADTDITNSIPPDSHRVIAETFSYAGQDLGNKVFLQFGNSTQQLDGQVGFCERLPKECDALFDNEQIVVLTKDLARELLDRNTEINARYTPQSDIDTYGEEEYWSYPSDAADCEDYVLLKRWELAQDLGIPLNAMSMIHVVTESTPDNPGGGHAVLAIRTDAGDLILDNLTDDIKLPYETDYKFMGATSFKNFQKWQEASLYSEQTDIKLPNGKTVRIGRPQPTP